MTERLRICSVSMSMPTVSRPRNGIFVRRRLSAINNIADVTAIMPSPWFPGVVATESPARDINFLISAKKMFYLPGIYKDWDRYWMRRAIQKTIKNLHRERPLHAIDAHFGFPTGAACCDIGQTLGIPTFVTVRGVEERQLQDKRIGPQLVNCLEKAHGIIAVSHSLSNAMLRAGLDEEKVCVIPNAVDTDLFCTKERTEVRRQYQLPMDTPIIVSVGSMEKRKGYHDLVKAFAELKKSIPHAMLVIAGGGVRYGRGYPEMIEKQILELGIQSSVRLLGSIPPTEIPGWLQAANVFALATYHEGCCNSVLEALGCGLPVVATKAGDNAKYIRDGENGYIVDVGAPDQLADRLIKVLNRSWDSKAIAQQVADYKWPDVAEKVIEFMHRRINRQ